MHGQTFIASPLLARRSLEHPRLSQIARERSLHHLEELVDVAVATHKTIDLAVHTQVYKLKRDMGK
jgi:hypothetical protein